MHRHRQALVAMAACKAARTSAISLLLAASTLAVYWPVGSFEFLDYDDWDYVAGNPHVRPGVTAEGVLWAFRATHAANWHPLTWLSHMLDCQLFGLQPSWHHLTNLLFHVANTLLLFTVLKRMTGAVWRSAFVAGLFAQHPLHVESVAWIAERKDVLSTFFFLLTLWAYVRYREEAKLQSSKSRVFYAASVLLFALGLMSKPMLVTMPFVLLLLDYWPLQRFTIRAGGKLWMLILEKLPFFVLAAASCWITVAAQRGRTIMPLETFSVPDRVANGLVSYMVYIWKMIWPAKLAFFYPLLGTPPMVHVVTASLLLLAVSAAVLLSAVRYPYAPVGWFWFLGALVPVIGLVHVGEQSMADRYTYIPLIGLFVLLSWGARDCLQVSPAWRRVVGVAALAVLVGSAVITRAQLRHWRNSRAVLEQALRVTKDNFLAHNNLGTILAGEKKWEAAAYHFFEAVRIKPFYARARSNLAGALLALGRSEEAIEQCTRALAIKPELAQAHYNLGTALAMRKQFADAIFHFREALRLEPDYPDALFNVAAALRQQDKTQEAVVAYQELLRLRPDDAMGHHQRATVLLKLGRDSEASAHFQQAVRLKPDWPEALNDAAWVLATAADPHVRNGPEAVRLAERANQLTGHARPGMLGTLAAAYAEAGRFNDAVLQAEEAVKQAEQAELREFAAETRTRIQLYRAGRPYHEGVRP